MPSDYYPYFSDCCTEQSMLPMATNIKLYNSIRRTFPHFFVTKFTEDCPNFLTFCGDTIFGRFM